jgi:hypothetical protein
MHLMTHKTALPLQASQDTGREHALLSHCFPQSERLTAQFFDSIQVPTGQRQGPTNEAQSNATLKTHAVKMVNLASDSSGCDGSMRSCESE